MEIDKLEGVRQAQGKPRWEDIPAGYNWRAQSYDGEWTAHYHMPRPHKNLGFWMSDCPLLETWAGAKNPLWNETLESRPPVVADGVAAAVAEAQGWIRHRYNANSHWWWMAGDKRLVCEVAEYRPDRDTAQAWELIEETRKIGACIVIGAFPPCYDVELYMSFSDFYAHNIHCVESAYTVGEVCTLICRAFLKAMAAT